jgi:hydroxymethylbilane synthase
MNRTLRIGARRSPLARVQAGLVGDALRRLEPGLAIDYRFIEASGDRSSEPSAALVTARGGFTEDLGRLLDEGAIDLAVHSWKDLPLGGRPGTAVVATLPRADARDVLLVRRDALAGIEERGLRILSSSARRRHHLEQFLAWALPRQPAGISFAPVRGDIGTRLHKLLRGDGDGLVIAKAAIDRLLGCDPDALASNGVQAADALRRARGEVREALLQCRSMVLPLSACPAAPAQGALALEVRNDSPWRHLLAAVNDPDCFELVLAERAEAARLGDDEPLGITRLRFEYGDVEFVRGSSAGRPFERVSLHRRGPALPRPASAASLWVGADAIDEERERSPLTAEPMVFDARTGLLVARSEALPFGSFVDPDAPVWTAGLPTWRRLAGRGLWVTGSDESLGETGAAAIREWFPEAREWVKLTHADGHWTPLARLLSTYRTRRRRALATVDRYSHFYWHSGTQLREYLAAYPQLRHAWHGCGPGNTFAIARQLLGPDRVRPFLGPRQFREELLA